MAGGGNTLKQGNLEDLEKDTKHHTSNIKSAQKMMDSFNNDIVIRFASYLTSQDLVNLSLTCRKFGSSQLHDSGSSLMEDTAHQIMCYAKEDERDVLPKKANQTYIELYSELEKIREPRVFDQLIGQDLRYVDNDKSHIKYNKKKRNYMRTNTGKSALVLFFVTVVCLI